MQCLQPASGDSTLGSTFNGSTQQPGDGDEAASIAATLVHVKAAVRVRGFSRGEPHKKWHSVESCRLPLRPDAFLQYCRPSNPILTFLQVPREGPGIA
jgi:hypothetical protein